MIILVVLGQGIYNDIFCHMVSLIFEVHAEVFVVTPLFSKEVETQIPLETVGLRGSSTAHTATAMS